MAQIAQVNYEDLARKANEMRAKAREANRYIKEAYMEIEMMKKDWYGIRYNTLATRCNAIIPDINKLMDLIVKTIPFSLETVANNYAMADRGQSVVGAQQTEAAKVLEIIQSTTNEMRFESAEVTSAQSKINTSFNMALTNIDAIDMIFGSIIWQSAAAEAYRAEFQKLKNSVRNAISEIQNVLGKLIQEAIADIASAESRNTVQ